MVWREKKIFNGSNLVISDEFLNLVYFNNVWLFNIICCRIRLISLFQIIGIRVWSNKNPNKNRTREVGPNKQCSFVSLLRLTQLRIFHQIWQWRKYLGELRGKSVYLFVCVCKCICIYEKMVCAFMYVYLWGELWGLYVSFIHAKNVWCCGEGYFGQNKFAGKVRKSRQNVDRDKSV